MPARLKLLAAALAAACLAPLVGCESDSCPYTSHDPIPWVVPDTLAFGEVEVGDRADLAFTLENAGGGTLAGSVSEECAEFSLVGEAAYSLAGGDSATFTVRFSPISEGAKACAVETGAADSSEVVCTGAGVLGPACQVSPAVLDFGRVCLGGPGQQRSFTIQNTGGGVLAGQVSASCGPFSVLEERAYSLAADDVDTFTVIFEPVLEGASACTLGTGSPQCPVVCHGTGGGPACKVYPTEINFGNHIRVGETRGGSFTIENTGCETLSGAASVLEGCPCIHISGDPSYVLEPGQSKTFSLWFRLDSAGTCCCSIVTGIPGCPTVCACGMVIGGVCCIANPTSLDFGSVAVGDSLDLTLSMFNCGDHWVSGTLSETCEDFGIAGDASYALSGGQSASFTVRFAPVSPGEKSCNIRSGATACPGVACSGAGALGQAAE